MQRLGRISAALLLAYPGLLCAQSPPTTGFAPPGAAPAADGGVASDDAEAAQQTTPPPAPAPAAPPPSAPPQTPPTHWYSYPYAPQAAAPFAPYPPPAYAEQPVTESVWYGWQTLILDGATLLLFVIGASQDRDDDAAPYLVAGFANWFLGPPIVHFSHGNIGEGFASVGLRVAPVVFALAFASECGWAGDRDEGACSLLVGAAVLSIPAAIALDAALLAYGEREVTSRSRHRPPSSVALVPWSDPRRSSWGLGVRAGF